MINLFDTLELICLGFGAVYLIQMVIINHINLSEYWWGEKCDEKHVQ